MERYLTIYADPADVLQLLTFVIPVAALLPETGVESALAGRRTHLPDWDRAAS